MGSVIGFVVLLLVVLVVCVIGALAVQWLGERMARREAERPPVRGRSARAEPPVRQPTAVAPAPAGDDGADDPTRPLPAPLGGVASNGADDRPGRGA